MMLAQRSTGSAERVPRDPRVTQARHLARSKRNSIVCLLLILFLTLDIIKTLQMSEAHSQSRPQNVCLALPHDWGSSTSHPLRGSSYASLAASSAARRRVGGSAQEHSGALAYTWTRKMPRGSAASVFQCSPWGDTMPDLQTLPTRTGPTLAVPRRLPHRSHPVGRPVRRSGRRRQPRDRGRGRTLPQSLDRPGGRPRSADGADGVLPGLRLRARRGRCAAPVRPRHAGGGARAHAGHGAHGLPTGRLGPEQAGHGHPRLRGDRARRRSRRAGPPDGAPGSPSGD